MRLIARLTARLLKAFPGRTAMAVLAIALSTAMLTAIVGFLQSAEDAMLRQVMEQNGRQHVKVDGLNGVQQLLVGELAAVQETWTQQDAPGVLFVRFRREALAAPEAVLKSAPLAALALVWADVDVDFNRELIALEAPGAVPMGEGFMHMTRFLMGVVVVCAVVVIANGFSISLSERTQRFGLLRSAGATARQIYASVLVEAWLLSLVGIPLGIVAGVLLQWGVLAVVRMILGDAFSGLTGVSLRPALSWRLVWVPGLVALGTVLISALRPAARAARVAPLQAVHELQQVRVRPRDVRTPRWVQRLLGVEGVLAARTMRRNRRKYLTGILSLTAASVLFISVTSFAALAQRADGDGESAGAYDLYVTLNGAGSTLLTQMDALVSQYAEGPVTRTLSMSLEAEVQEGSRWPVMLASLPPETLRMYATANGVQADSVLDAPKPSALLCNAQGVPMFDDGDTQAPLPLALPLMPYEPWHEEPKPEKPFAHLTVVAQADNPAGIPLPPGVVLVLPDTHFDHVHQQLTAVLGENAARERISMEYSLSTPAHAEFARQAQELIDQHALAGTLHYGYVQDVAANQSLAARLILVVKLFVYGFIAMLTMIAITSVVSTLSTSVALRRRQFALLRSTGMTPQGVMRTLRLESVLYALTTCMLGVPLGLLCAYAMHRLLATGLPFVPAWGTVLAVIPASFLISWLTLSVSSRQLKTLHIADTLKGL
jgi:putative ABC transport system permease protein